MSQWLVIALIAVAVVVVVGLTVVLVRRREPQADLLDVSARPREAPPLSTLRHQLAKTRRAFGDRLGAVLQRDRFDEDFWEELEDELIGADVGVEVATQVAQAVRRSVPEDAAAVRDAVASTLLEILSQRDRTLHLANKPAVVLVVGVNGTGKTTSIAKIAARLGNEGRRVILGAADTFRAAADEQLRVWADRVGVEVVGGRAGADPASVAYDAYQQACGRGADAVIVDTAGRLHSKANLMDELGKVARVLRREAGELDEVLLVIDGTTGQNAISQARSFTDAVGVTGIVVTKLDGTAKGGIALAIENELGAPVKFIGVGEGIEDLVAFDPAEFIDALVGA